MKLGVDSEGISGLFAYGVLGVLPLGMLEWLSSQVFQANLLKSVILLFHLQLVSPFLVVGPLGQQVELGIALERLGGYFKFVTHNVL